MILCTLDNKKQVKEFYLNKRIKPYSILTLFCFVVSYIYSLFSHGVSSIHMSFMFLYPLIFGVLSGIIVMICSKTKKQYFFATHLYHTGVIALLLSSMLRGIFEIAGTASDYQIYLMCLGILMIGFGVICFIIKK